RVQRRLGRRVRERELGGTACEDRRLLAFDRARRRRELSRGHHLAPEAPRRTSQRNRSPATLEARTRLRYFVTPTEKETSHRGVIREIEAGLSGKRDRNDRAILAPNFSMRPVHTSL